jgi:hypothetical protein
MVRGRNNPFDRNDPFWWVYRRIKAVVVLEGKAK